MQPIVDVCARIGVGRPEETRPIETALARDGRVGDSASLGRAPR